MAIANVVSRWVAGNLQFQKRTDGTVCAGIVAVSGTTTKAGGVLAVPITARFVTMTSGGVEALTLADGAPGQRLTLLFGTDGGDATLTPARKTGFATIVFATAKDTATMEYIDDTIGWILLSVWGASTTPVVT